MLDILSQIPQGFTVAIQDESIFIHDILVRRKLWLPKRIRPVVTTTGSHQKTCVFGISNFRWHNSSLSMICLTRIHSLTIKKDNEKTGKGNPVYRQGHSTRVKESARIFGRERRFSEDYLSTKGFSPSPML